MIYRFRTHWGKIIEVKARNHKEANKKINLPGLDLISIEKIIEIPAEEHPQLF
jgi:hypothetical protein